MMQASYDVAVVGAGVVGCAVARELSKLELDVVLIEAEEDVCDGTSKANSAIVHAGFDAHPGTLKAKLNVEGNRLMYPLCHELDVAIMNIGSLVVCTNEEERPALEALYERGIQNGVEGMRIVERDELVQMEPNIADEAVCALLATSAGIVDVFGLTIALAENAVSNGVTLELDTRISGVERRDGGYLLTSADGREFKARCVVNACGLFSDELHNMVSDEKLRIICRRGEYMLLDTTAATHVAHTVFSLPGKLGKGVLVSPTVHGNLIVGPTAADIEDKEGTDTTKEGLDAVAAGCTRSVKNVPLREVITSFAGIRAHLEEGDFRIGEVEGAPGFIDCVGIESPGLTAAPAIGVMVADMVKGILGASAKPQGAFNGTRKGIVNLHAISQDAWNELVEKDPAYGQIICRCCLVSEAQIVDAIHREPGARSIDGVKRRTGVTMGRCQGGFCTPRLMEILARELGGLELDTVTKTGEGSALIVGRPKELEGGGAR